MDIQKYLKIKFIQIGYNLIDLKSSPLLFQKFLESVPDFFIERQGVPADSNEATNIMSILEKILMDAGYEYSHLIVNQNNENAKRFTKDMAIK